MFARISQVLGALAVLASLLFVGYELQRNNDLAVVQSQHELLGLQIGMKEWLTDPETLRILTTEDYTALPADEQLVFFALVGAWFDLYEAVFLARKRHIITDEQYLIWRNGMCTVPSHWLRAFQTMINQDNYLPEVIEEVDYCIAQDRRS
jgi:hypothetical protein